MTPLARGRALLAEARRRLLDCPDVAGVGLGMQAGGRPAWRVYVTRPAAGRHVPATLLGLPAVVVPRRAGRAVSKTPTVYTAGLPIESHQPGSLLSSGPSAQGALGCFALDAQGKHVLLTNSHVMFPAFLTSPQAGVYQPDYSSCCSGGDKIATPVFDPKEIVDGKFKGGFTIQLGRYKIPAPAGDGFTMSDNTRTCSLTDCAIARLDPGVHFRNVLPVPGGEIPINGANPDVLSVLGPRAGSAPTAEQYVRVFTPRDGGKLIYGTIMYRLVDDPGPDITKIDEGTPDEHLASPIFNYGFVDQDAAHMEAIGTIPVINQFVILPRPRPIPGEADYRKYYGQPNEMLSFDHGDSGSVVVDSRGRVIAQIVGGFPFDLGFVRKPSDRGLIEFTKVGNVAVASPIRDILDLLKITIPGGGFSGAVPASGGGAAVQVSPFAVGPEAAALRRGGDRLRAGLRASRRGRLLLGKIAQHRGEVRRLLAAVRPIAAAWSELGGPALYHHCVRSAREPGHAIPDRINGVGRDRLVEVLAPLFARHGSPELRRDIARYGPWLAAALPAVSTLDDVPGALSPRRPRR